MGPKPSKPATKVVGGVTVLKGRCFNVNGSGEVRSDIVNGSGRVESQREVLWDSILGGVKIERGIAMKACFKGPNCTGSKELETEGVGSDFSKA
eukprot:tig00000123_g6909.t1